MFPLFATGIRNRVKRVEQGGEARRGHVPLKLLRSGGRFNGDEGESSCVRYCRVSGVVVMWE